MRAHIPVSNLLSAAAILLLGAGDEYSFANAFSVPATLFGTRNSCISLFSKRPDSGEAAGEVVQQQAFSTGSFVEFVEKKRGHVGKIESVEHKSKSGSARYRVVDSEGKAFDISHKDILYNMPCPNTPAQATKLYDEFCRAQDTPVATIQTKLQITPDLLEMAWEEAALTMEEDENDDDEAAASNGGGVTITPASFIELVHAHSASAMEKYFAWKLLQSETAHVFFKEIKDHGRVVAFKAKTRKAVEAAKDVFCRSPEHKDNEVCFV